MVSCEPSVGVHGASRPEVRPWKAAVQSLLERHDVFGKEVGKVRSNGRVQMWPIRTAEKGGLEGTLRGLGKDAAGRPEGPTAAQQNQTQRRSRSLKGVAEGKINVLCVAGVDAKEPEQFAHMFLRARNKLFENEHLYSTREVSLKSLDPIGIEPPVR